MIKKKPHTEFEDIRPYCNAEVPNAIQRILKSIHFQGVVKYVFPDEDLHTLTERFKKIKTTDEFQTEIMYVAVKKIVQKTIQNFTYSGLETLSNDFSYMYIANHRDIVLDSALLQLALYENKLKTSEITFGSNLMNPQIVVDIGKLNKMFKIVRGGTIREVFKNSMNVSQYMRYVITEKKESTWIAQRNGRTKNGQDETDVAVLKMFAMSSPKSFVENLKELNITPITISYEYEPCDFFKTREVYISRRKKYEKDAGEDLMSIIKGIKQWKGNVHVSVSHAITEDELKKCAEESSGEKFKLLAKIIDKRIYNGYKLWPTNYIAYDLLHNQESNNQHYTEAQKNDFIAYMTAGLKGIDGNKKELELIFLEIYATPVENNI